MAKPRNDVARLASVLGVSVAHPPHWDLIGAFLLGVAVTVVLTVLGLVAIAVFG